MRGLNGLGRCPECLTPLQPVVPSRAAGFAAAAADRSGANIIKRASISNSFPPDPRGALRRCSSARNPSPPPLRAPPAGRGRGDPAAGAPEGGARRQAREGHPRGLPGVQVRRGAATMHRSSSSKPDAARARGGKTLGQCLRSPFAPSSLPWSLLRRLLFPCAGRKSGPGLSAATRRLTSPPPPGPPAAASRPPRRSSSSTSPRPSAAPASRTRASAPSSLSPHSPAPRWPRTSACPSARPTGGYPRSSPRSAPGLCSTPPSPGRCPPPGCPPLSALPSFIAIPRHSHKHTLTLHTANPMSAPCPPGGPPRGRRGLRRPPPQLRPPPPYLLRLPWVGLLRREVRRQRRRAAPQLRHEPAGRRRRRREVPLGAGDGARTRAASAHSPARLFSFSFFLFEAIGAALGASMPHGNAPAPRRAAPHATSTTLR